MCVCVGGGRVTPDHCATRQEYSQQSRNVSDPPQCSAGDWSVGTGVEGVNGMDG